ncbi:VOC family protein [Thalassospira sp.]|uniref:VOC family protein n=1 Tax=Thalassospira sp. TaxID=1912094 RepID=UPI0032ECDF44|tara:strand:+ start:206 stop:577 length:372 start_codon:yes stop_codon:yes gene_type:complete
MIGYTSLGTNNLDQSGAFYDALFGCLGIGRVMEVKDFIVWGKDFASPCFSIHIPFDGKAASVGNGTMIAVRGESRQQVDDVYDKALSLGGSSEGAPGPRNDDGFYAAYFRDLDGNKLNIHFMG